jgi:hypothetical protein
MVPNVESDDVVDSGDAAIQALLALTAENTHDHERRKKLLDAILTVPPLTEWPPDCREKLWEARALTNEISRGRRLALLHIDVETDLD